MTRILLNIVIILAGLIGTCAMLAESAPIREQTRPAFVQIGRHIEAEIEWRDFKVRAYTLSQKECGKPPGDPNYGRTASGRMAKLGVTVAAGPEIPLGSWVYIPELAGVITGNETGLFRVDDRGGLVKEGCIDLFFGDPETDPDCIQRALKFGRKELKGAVVDR